MKPWVVFVAGVIVGVSVAVLWLVPEVKARAQAPVEPLAVPPGSLRADVFYWRRAAEGVTGVRLVGHGWHVATRPPSYGSVQ